MTTLLHFQWLAYLIFYFTFKFIADNFLIGCHFATGPEKYSLSSDIFASTGVRSLEVSFYACSSWEFKANLEDFFDFSGWYQYDDFLLLHFQSIVDWLSNQTKWDPFVNALLI